MAQSLARQIIEKRIWLDGKSAQWRAVQAD